MIAEVSGTASKVKLERLTIAADCGLAVHPDQGAAQLEGGLGEVGVPLVAPAVANAVYNLTGKRIRALPLEDGGVTFA